MCWPQRYTLFNTFYEYLRDVYRKDMEKRDIKVTLSDFNINNLLTTLKQYYRGGRYDFLLNSDKNIDLLSKRFIVFEIDQVKDNKDLFPVVTIIIMEAFINKMRRLKGIRKMILIEEAWKAIASANMADYIKYLYKTVRKYFGEAIVVTQEVDDIIQSPIVKESIWLFSFSERPSIACIPSNLVMYLRWSSSILQSELLIILSLTMGDWMISSTSGVTTMASPKYFLTVL